MTWESACIKPRPRRGFTLTEMLVALAIMAILTTVAMQSLGPVADQARFEVTQRTLSGAREAILSTSSSAVSGFLVDMGRPPATVDELLLQGTLPSWAIGTSGVPYGWKGPYLVPPVTTLTSTSATSVVDGWGQPLALTSDTTGVTIASSGGPSTGTIVATLPAAGMYASSLVVTFTSATQTSTNVSGTASLWYATDAGVTSTTQSVSGNSCTFVYSSAGLSSPLWVGPKALTLSASGATATPVYFVLRPGANTLTVQVTSTSSSSSNTQSSSSQ